MNKNLLFAVIFWCLLAVSCAVSLNKNNWILPNGLI